VRIGPFGRWLQAPRDFNSIAHEVSNLLGITRGKPGLRNRKPSHPTEGPCSIGACTGHRRGWGWGL